jgi:hypothetical protein
MNLRVGQQVLWYTAVAPTPFMAVLVDIMNGKVQLRLGKGIAARYVWVDRTRVIPYLHLPKSRAEDLIAYALSF